MISPAPRLEQLKKRDRHRLPDNWVPPNFEAERTYQIRMEMDLPPIPDLVPLCWPPSPDRYLSATHEQLRWLGWLSRQPVENMPAFLSVVMDIRHGLTDVAVPARKGRATVSYRFLIERAGCYYKPGRGGVDFDRRPGLRSIKLLLGLTEISTECLRAAGIKLRRGARRGHYLLTRKKRNDLDWFICVLEAHGIRVPEGGLHAARYALDPDTEALLPVSGGKISCPAHGEERPSCVVHANGTLYCYGECRRCVGEWRAPETADWTVRPILDRERRMAEKAETAIPSLITARLYRGYESAPAQGVLEADQAPPTPTQREIVIRHPKPSLVPALSDMPLPEPPAEHVPGDPGSHPLDMLCERTDAWKSSAAWLALRDRFPTTVEWRENSRIPADYGSRIRPLGYLRCEQLDTKSGRSTLGRSYDPNMDLIDAQVRSDRHSQARNVWPHRVRAYQAARDIAGGAPDPANYSLCKMIGGLKNLRQQYLSVGVWRHTATTKKCWNGVEVVEPDQRTFSEIATKYLLVDVDKLTIPGLLTSASEAEEAASDWNLTFGGRVKTGKGKGGHVEHGDRLIEGASPEIQRLADSRPEFTGRMYVLRSGPAGVQVAFELKQARWNPSGLWADKSWRALVAHMGAGVIKALHGAGCADGMVDPNVNHRGNLARRASWRVAKDGTLFRSRLIYTTPRRPWEA